MTASQATTHSSDRTSDLWGDRTPHARGTRWPTRLDQHLDAGLTDADVDAWVQSACVLCSNGCAADIAVRDGRMVGVRGRPDDRVNRGRLGPKGLYGSWPWAAADDRLTAPLVRDGGDLREASWDEAMGRVVGAPASRSRRDRPDLVRVWKWCTVRPVVNSCGYVVEGSSCGGSQGTVVRDGPVGLLRDLQDLYVLAALVQSSWTVVLQAAQGARDSELIEVVQHCLGETGRQMTWLTTRIKQAAPQALLVAG